MVTPRMTSRERIKAAIRYEPVDRLPVADQLWQQVPDMWRKQGLPAGVTPEDYFGFDINYTSLDCSARFEQKILERANGFVTYEDRCGYTVRKPDEKSGTLEFLNFITDSRETWETKVKPLLVLDQTGPARIDSASYFAHFDPYPTWEEAVLKFRELYDTDRFLVFETYGPWESTWRHCGYDSLLLNMAMDPDWIKEMADDYMNLLLETLEHCISLGMRPDGFFLVDDLACNRGLNFSPTMWRDIFRPGYEKLGALLKKHEIDFLMHCCGNCEELIEDLIECGLQVLQPLQVRAGLDLVELRKKYEQRLGFWGNIHAEAMAGPIEPLRESIHRKLPGTLNGGYILASDHSVPPDVTFERFDWIIKEANRVAAGSS